MMKGNNKLKKEKVEKKELKIYKKRPGISYRNIRNGIRIAGWLLILGSFSFAVYKNFTAVDKETIIKHETVVEKVYNTSGMEEFTRDFANVYFSLSPDGDAINNRFEKLQNYMQPDLVDINRGNENELQEEVTVEEVQIWNISPVDGENQNYIVQFSVKQKVGKIKKTHTYQLSLHAETNAYVVIKNPTIISDWEKSDYERKYLVSDDLLKTEETKKITEFLETFFNVYPKATAKELIYYVKDSSIKALENKFEFVTLSNVQIRCVNQNTYQIECFVKYLETDTKISSMHQFDLILGVQEDGEYVITEMR